MIDMFTGLIQSVGKVAFLTGTAKAARLRIRAEFRDGPLAPGESVAVDGACLTVTAFERDGFEADVSAETLARTTIGSWRSGRRVNLERALTPSSRLGGHLVQGHVDGRGRVIRVTRGRHQTTLRVVAPAPLRPLIAEKGSIAVDGVSLTVSALVEDGFEVALIPHTLAETNLADRRPRDEVNLEADIVARHVARLLAATNGRSLAGILGAGTEAIPGRAGPRRRRSR